MAQQYSNIPSEKTPNETIKGFEDYKSPPLELNSSVFSAMKGYFTNHGFGDVSAESITITLMSQAQRDGYNPMKILDSLRGFSNLELSALVAEILNYNRYKSSSLGFAPVIAANSNISRNIIESNSGSTTIAVTKYSIRAVNSNTNVITSIDKTYPLYSYEPTDVSFVIDANVPNGTRLFWELENGYFDNSGSEIRFGSILIYNKTNIINENFSMNFLYDNVDPLSTSQIVKFNLRIGNPTGKIVATTKFTILKSIVYDLDYVIFNYQWTDGRDLDTATGIYPAIGSTNDKSYVRFWSTTYLDLLYLDHDNTTNGGIESVLLDINNLAPAYPDATDIELDCRATWYSSIGINPVELKITGYKGGSVVNDNGVWTNITADNTVDLNPLFDPVQITSDNFSHINNYMGQGIARIYYSIVNKQLIVLPWNKNWDTGIVTGYELTDNFGEILTDQNGDSLTIS